MATDQTWPSGLPAPQLESHSLTLGSNTVWRELENGEREGRRFGTGAPHRLQCSLLLFGNDVAMFQEWHRTQLNGGRNWFYASWLALFGLENHYARIQGYLVRESKGSLWSRFSLTLLIVPEAQAWADAFWQSAGTGGAEPGDDPVEGEVVTWGHSNILSSMSNYPTGLRATWVACDCVGSNNTVWGYGVAVKADGTLAMWGNSGALSYFSGWDSLGGIARVYPSRGGMLYITKAGSIGYLGDVSTSITDYIPTLLDAVDLVWPYTNTSQGFSAMALRANGAVVPFGSKAATYPVPAMTLPVQSMAVGGGSFPCWCVVDGAGTLKVWGKSYPSPAYDMISTAPAVNNARIVACVNHPTRFGLGVVQDTTGAWQMWGGAVTDVYGGNFRNIPTGLIAKSMMFLGPSSSSDSSSHTYGGGVALHTDGTVAVWGGSPILSNLTPPAGLKAHQVWGSVRRSTTSVSVPNFFGCAAIKIDT